MTPTALFIATLILVPAVGLVAWAWFTMERFEEGLRSLRGFKRKDFEIGPWASGHYKGTK